MQSSLSLTSVSGSTPLNKTLATSVSGGTGSGLVTYATYSSDICSIDKEGVVHGIKIGFCRVLAIKQPSPGYAIAQSNYLEIEIKNAILDQLPLLLTVDSGTILIGKSGKLISQGGSGEGNLGYALVEGSACSLDKVSGAIVGLTEGVCSFVATKVGDLQYSSQNSNFVQVRVVDVPVLPTIDQVINLPELVISFKLGSYKLLGKDIAKIDKLNLQYVKEVVVIGYAKPSPSSVADKKLAYNRALAVARHLEIRSSHIKIKILSMGAKFNPLCSPQVNKCAVIQFK